MADEEQSREGGKEESDIQDQEKDLKHLEPEEITMELPEVSDIPGQEHIIPPKMNAFSDTTISSDDEEGKGIFDDDDEEPEPGF